MNFFLSFVLISNFFAITKSAPLNLTEALDFLVEFGFVNKSTSSKEIENGVKTYQNIFKIPETGKLDAATLAQMDQPMCRSDGVEVKNDLNVWKKNHLTYQIKNGPVSGRLNKRMVKDELKEAFKMWAQHIPLSFEENNDSSDIKVRFINPGNSRSSDGRGKTLAFAFYPDVGDIFFDAEDWSIDSSKGYNFRVVAAHEIGHSLGLDHSKNKKSLMYPSYKPLGAGWTLHDSDISRIKGLYGKDHVCQFGQIDGLFPHHDSIVVVKGQYCWKFEKNQIKDGFPKLCQKLWINFPAKIDAIFKDNDKINFFSGNQLFLYENQQQLPVYFSGKAVKKIDTVLTIHDRLYIFEGPKYWTFVKKNNSWIKKTDAKEISHFWKGVPSDLDAAIFDNSKYVFFFKNSDVYKFDIDAKNTVKSPVKIDEYFQC